MPTDASVQDCGASSFDSFGEGYDFVPCLAVRDQVDQRNAVDYDEIRPNRLAATANDFDGQAHTVGVRATPFVCPLISVGHKEFVKEIPFRSHNLDPVISRLFRAFSGDDKIRYLLFDPFSIQLAW